jgi:hypothetical protein
VTDTDTTTPDVPHIDPEDDPLAPISRPLWRMDRGDRIRRLTPFIGHQVMVERWPLRVASRGEQTYGGSLIAIARTTIGSAADLLILRTPGGTNWAISTAQVAHLRLRKPNE